MLTGYAGAFLVFSGPESISQLSPAHGGAAPPSRRRTCPPTSCPSCREVNAGLAFAVIAAARHAAQGQRNWPPAEVGRLARAPREMYTLLGDAHLARAA